MGERAVCHRALESLYYKKKGCVWEVGSPQPLCHAREAGGKADAVWVNVCQQCLLRQVLGIGGR